MKKKVLVSMVSVLLAVGLISGCSGNASTTTTTAAAAADTTAAAPADTTAAGQKFKVGLSQGTMNHPFRVAMVEKNVEYAEENFPDMDIIVTDGQNDSAKQVSDVEDLIAQGIDCLIISPLTAEALTDVCQKAMDAGIPVITLDRNVNCEVTSCIGAENKPMGVAAADKLAGMTNNKGTIVEIQGTAGASVTIDRHDGFNEELAKYPDMKVISTQYCDYLRENAMKYMEDMLQRFGPGEITAVYAHNDEMALGALEAIRAAGREDEGILLIGMDGTEVAFDEIKTGAMSFTIVYPYCAPEGVIYAHKVLTGEKIDSRIFLDTAIVDSSNINDWSGKGL